MPTAQEEAEERAVFDDASDDDDDDDTDGGDDSSESDSDDPSSVAGGHAPAAAPQPSTAVHPKEELNPIPTPNPNPNPLQDTPAAPQNGAVIPVLPISSSTPTAAGDASASLGGLFTPSSDDRKPAPNTAAFDESRRLFQRLWTDEDEIKILQGFLEFTSRRGTTFASHQYDTGPFYEEIKKQLQLDFTKNQLIEKLRRLKKKYRNCVGRMRSNGKDFAFKSPHEKAIFDIARNIWSASVKRARDSDDDEMNTPSAANYSNDIGPVNDVAVSSERRMSRSRRRFRRRSAEEAAAAAAAVAAVGGAVPVPVAIENSIPVTHTVTHTPTPTSATAAIPSIIEETVRSCLSPLFKELISSAIGGGGGPFGPGLGGGGAPALSPLPLNLGGGVQASGAAGVDEKWKQQQILELEVYLKRIELVRDQIKSTLEELKSSGS